MGLKRVATRLEGAGTAVFGAVALARPGIIAGQWGLDGSDPGTRLMAATLGARDLIAGVAILAAPDRRTRRFALLVRGLFDVGDAVAAYAILPDPGARRRFAVLASASGVVSLSLALTG